MLNSGSFVSKVKSSRVNDLFLVAASDQGRDCWFYVHVEKSKTPFFEKLVEQNQLMDLSEYGRIVISGWGKQPPERVKQKIADEGVNFHLSPEEIEAKIYFVTADNGEGRDFYSFVSIPGYLGEEFQRRFYTEGVNFSDYGVVIKAGWGNYPTEDVIKYIEDNYNFNRSEMPEQGLTA